MMRRFVRVAGLAPPPPSHRDWDHVRDTMLVGLAYHAADYRLGPAQLALIFTAAGLTPPIPWPRWQTEQMALEVAGKRYRSAWAWAKRQARRMRAAFVVLPVRPAPLRRGGQARLRGPFMRLLPTNRWLAVRPQDVPARAGVKVVLRRGARIRRSRAGGDHGRWIYAQWRAGSRVRSVSLGRASASPTEIASESRPR
jgi:hypothetical protein